MGKQIERVMRKMSCSMRGDEDSRLLCWMVGPSHYLVLFISDLPRLNLLAVGWGISKPKSRVCRFPPIASTDRTTSSGICTIRQRQQFGFLCTRFFMACNSLQSR